MKTSHGMVGTDGQAVHRFRCAGEICAVIADPSGVSRRVGARPTVTCAFGFVGRARHSVRAVHNAASPGNYRDWHSYLLAADQQAYSVAVITFKFSVAALLSLVPGRTFSRNQH